VVSGFNLRDDLESIDLFEPLMVSDGARSRFKSAPPAIANSLAEVVRTANCYYSNLIEGYDVDGRRRKVSDATDRCSAQVQGRSV
jgi:hypothetical protein